MQEKGKSPSMHDQSVKSARAQTVFKPYRKIPEACKKRAGEGR